MHKEIIIRAARAGKHVYCEKVLATTTVECEEILAEIKSANVKLMTSLPKLVESFYLYAQEVADKGLLGKINTVRCRCTHGGAIPFEGHPYGFLPSHFFDPDQTGGGALIDLGAHPNYLVNRFGGNPKAVTARLESFYNHQVDDNAIAVIEYESGVLGMCETSFISKFSPFLKLEVYGSEGTLLIEDHDIRIRSSKLQQNKWFSPQVIPQKLPTPMEQWIQSMKDGTTPTITELDALRLTQINEAAALSHRSGQRIVVQTHQVKA